MKHVILFSYHYYGSRRRAGFHWLADAFHNLGWDVIFVTAPISWLHKLSGNFRFDYPVRKEANRMVERRPRFSSYVLFSMLHPANFRSDRINRLMRGLPAAYSRIDLGALEDRIGSADVIIFESTPALVLFDRLKTINPKARMIYRVSDDTELLDLHPLVRDFEKRAAPRFDLVSVPSEYLMRKFGHLENCRLQHHGIFTEYFDAEMESPFREGSNAVYVGNHPYLDWECLNTALDEFPELKIHVIGAADGGSRRRGMILHGEIPFEETLPYIRYADIGLHPVTYVKGAEAATDTLKVIQFSYCGLPVVMPEFIRTGRTNVFYYRPGDRRSVIDCFNRAMAYHPPVTDETMPAWSWMDLAGEMLNMIGKG